MEVYVNYPDDEAGKKELSQAVAIFRATLVMKEIESLNLDRESEKKVVKKLLEVVKEKSKLEKDTSLT